MKRVIQYLFLGVLLAGCNTTPIQTPHVEQPKLVDVRLVGNRMCGSKIVDQQEYLDDCRNELPTITQTFWVLAPLHLPNTSNPNRLRLNRAVRFTVTTPTLTNLEVAYFAGSGQRYVLNQLAPAPESPPVIVQGAANQSAEVAMSDDGITRTWHVVVYKNGCLGSLPLEFVNVASNGSSRSSPIKATILRDDERACVEGTAVGGGGGSGTFLHADSGSSGSSGSSVSSGSCMQTFKLCLTCPKGVSALAQYIEIAACSRSDAFNTVGANNTGFPSQCSLVEVSSRSACEGH